MRPREWCRSIAPARARDACGGTTRALRLMPYRLLPPLLVSRQGAAALGPTRESSLTAHADDRDVDRAASTDTHSIPEGPPPANTRRDEGNRGSPPALVFVRTVRSGDRAGDIGPSPAVKPHEGRPLEEKAVSGSPPGRTAASVDLIERSSGACLRAVCCSGGLLIRDDGDGDGGASPTADDRFALAEPDTKSC
jgi:hypothetical protein